MRFLISLQRDGKTSFLPINYQYELSSLIYKTIDRADSNFSRFLHEQGYLAYGRRFRLFTFSRISFDSFRIVKDAGRIEHRGQLASFEITFMVDRAAEEFIKGLFLDQTLVLGDKISRVGYRVSGIEALTPPVFKEQMHFRCLSPIFLRRKRDAGGEDYLHPNDKDYGRLLLLNLLSKSSAFAGAGHEKTVQVAEEIPDFSFKPSGKIFKNGVRIKQLTEKETQLIGYRYEFELRAPLELQKVGYYAGFGHLGSQGFGCVEMRES